MAFLAPLAKAFPVPKKVTRMFLEIVL